MSYLQNCARHWFEMKSNALNFWRLIQELFWRAPYFKSKNKTSFQFMRNERGKSVPPYGGPPPLVPHERKVCFCFWNMVRAKKVSELIFKNWVCLISFPVRFKAVTYAVLQIWRLMKLLKSDVFFFNFQRTGTLPPLGALVKLPNS